MSRSQQAFFFFKNKIKFEKRSLCGAIVFSLKKKMIESLYHDLRLKSETILKKTNKMWKTFVGKFFLNIVHFLGL